MSQQRGHRQPGDLEVGINDVFLPHEAPHVAPRPEAPQWLTNWETRRPRLAMELAAEFFGVLLYCWAGMGATAAFFVSSALKEEGFGSLLNIAFCYTFAIVLAIVVIGPTSGGHLNPCMTIAFAVFKGFPWRKVVPYIIAQIFGGMIAGLLVYAQFQPALHEITTKLNMGGLGAQVFTPQGPAGSIALFMTPGAKIGIVFVNELVCTILIGVVVFSVLDPSNVFVTPASGPITIAIIYFIAIICFGSNGVALNTARDLGARLAVACIWGRKAFPAKYTALTALTNIIGTLIGAFFQVTFLSDTVRPPTAAALAVHHAQTSEKEAHLQRVLTSKSGGGEASMGRMFSGLGRTVTPKTNGAAAHIEEKHVV